MHQFFQERGFVYVHTPLITGSDCEVQERCSVLQHWIWTMFRRTKTEL
ncbi:MAG: hypothetical protein V8S55_05890 [Mediterraneibacter faecis]